ncbi:MAG: leucine-rich repeat domain-containing protein [Oscillospiraceae bacterium]|nr:leucine-rich repeat domain-containing protein [Oscillospiraceae bacterium]
MFDRLFSKKKKITSPFHITDHVLYRYHSFVNDALSVTVPDGVTEIAGFAFESCNRIEQITIPAGVRTIGEGAFAGCRSLRSVKLPSTLETIEKDAFAHCSSLRAIHVPDGVVRMGEGVFRECVMLRDIRLSAELTQIPAQAFSGCKQLSEIAFPKRLLGIQERAFQNCKALTEITFPAGLRMIYPGAFSNCKALRSVTFAERIETIDKEAFDSCLNLEEMHFLHRQGCLTLHNPHMRRQAGMIAEFLRRPSTSQLNWMHAHCAIGLMMEFVGELFLQYPVFEDYLHDFGDRFGRFLIEAEDSERLLELLKTDWLSDEGKRSMLDYAIEHTQSGGSAEPQMLMMRFVQPKDAPAARFRL